MSFFPFNPVGWMKKTCQLQLEQLYQRSNASTAISPTELLCSDRGTSPPRALQSALLVIGQVRWSGAGRLLVFQHACPNGRLLPDRLPYTRMSASFYWTGWCRPAFGLWVWGLTDRFLDRNNSFSNLQYRDFQGPRQFFVQSEILREPKSQWFGFTQGRIILQII